MVSFEEFTDIYDVLYALGYAPERGLDEEELEKMYDYLDRTQVSAPTIDGFPIMHLVDTLGEGIFDVFDGILDRAQWLKHINATCNNTEDPKNIWATCALVPVAKMKSEFVKMNFIFLKLL